MAFKDWMNNLRDYFVEDDEEFNEPTRPVQESSQRWHLRQNQRLKSGKCRQTIKVVAQHNQLQNRKHKQQRQNALLQLSQNLCLKKSYNNKPFRKLNH